MAAPAVGVRVPQATFADLYNRMRIGQKIGAASQSGNATSAGTMVKIASFTAAMTAGDVVELNYQGTYLCSVAAGWGELTLRAKAGTVAADTDTLCTDGQADINANPTTANLLTPIRWTGEYTCATTATYVFSAWIQRKSASGNFVLDEANGTTGRLWGRIVDVA